MIGMNDMNIKLLSFDEYRQTMEESGAARRAKRDAFLRGTMPPMAPINVNSGNSGTPAEVEGAKKVKTQVDVEQEKKRKGRKKKADKENKD